MQKIYVSRYKNYVVQVKPSKMFIHESGISKHDGGIAIRFNNGSYTAKNDAEIELLESSPSFGVDFFDLLKQENEAKNAQAKVEQNIVKVIEGVRGYNNSKAIQIDDPGNEKKRPGRPKRVVEPKVELVSLADIANEELVKNEEEVVNEEVKEEETKIEE